MRFIMQHWQDRQRQVDIEVLWPACLRNSRVVGCTRRAFTIHALNDPAWTVLGTGEILRQVALLPHPRIPRDLCSIRGSHAIRR
ncbi:hypothetical protein [Bosea sp. BIWAKO-01]|uniref:hypothetical protein n=1 Tax=Bosea sp. BIWAKO-01 TaxID=506668 RepID=UPI00114CBA07|nr:hypothetical protein [Bosea sp. BIWAKO-01]